MRNLFLQYFESENVNRRIEFNHCIKRNIENILINRVYILIENVDISNPLFQSEKVTILVVNKRLTYRETINYINRYSNVDDINMFCNLDIYFDESIINFDLIDNNTFIALTRWDVNLVTHSIKFFNRKDSQDSWIWKGHLNLDKFNLNYYLGTKGCDNAICGEFYENGFKVCNPSLKIKTYHLHNLNNRTYLNGPTVNLNLYTVTPTYKFNSVCELSRMKL